MIHTHSDAHIARILYSHMSINCIKSYLAIVLQVL